MGVADVFSTDTLIRLMAFSTNGTGNKDNFVVYNLGKNPVEIAIEISGTPTKTFAVYRTSESEKYLSLGDRAVSGGKIVYEVPPRSVTTFFGK